MKYLISEGQLARKDKMERGEEGRKKGRKEGRRLRKGGEAVIKNANSGIAAFSVRDLMTERHRSQQFIK